jgi:Ca-activated chloride channel family protein
MHALTTFALAAVLLAGLANPAAQAASPKAPQDAPPAAQSMLVLDASGSMWGRIGGKPKIEIAREAVASMLEDWPAQQQLGLMVYGHRSKGDCADIELLKAPAAVDKADFQKAVNALQPKGMTPLTAAVRLAAEQLKFSEQKATVILVSDGEETCQADPCALGQELEKLGVDFTAHVVGFDIDKNAKAKAQLQCLARSTGGRYLDARDAGELNKALREVAQAPAAPAEPPACGQFVEGPVFALNRSTWSTGEEASLSAQAKNFEPIEMGADARPQACQKLCDEDQACTAWFFEAIGSNFRTLPVCFRWDGRAALSPPQEGHPGNAMGVKKGVLQIVRQAGAACR